MIRIIVRHDNCGMAANVGGAVFTEFKTFDISAPEVEKYLKRDAGTYKQTQIVGVELVEPEST